MFVLRLFRLLIPRRGRIFRGMKVGRYKRRHYGGVRGAAERWLQTIVLNWGDIDYLRMLAADMRSSPRGGQPFLRACVEILERRITDLELQQEFDKLFKLFGF